MVHPERLDVGCFGAGLRLHARARESATVFRFSVSIQRQDQDSANSVGGRKQRTATVNSGGVQKEAAAFWWWLPHTGADAVCCR